MRFTFFPELSETQRGRHPVGLNVVTHDRLLIAGMQIPRALGNFDFRLSRSGMLSDMVRPRGDQHFGPEGSRIFQALVDAVEKSAIAQEDQTQLFNQQKILFAILGTNHGLHSDRDWPIIGLRHQWKIVRGL